MFHQAEALCRSKPPAPSGKQVDQFDFSKILDTPLDRVGTFPHDSPARIIAISRMIKDDMVRSYGIDGQRIELVYNGVDTNRFNPGLRERLRGPFRQALGFGTEEVVFLFAHL